MIKLLFKVRPLVLSSTLSQMWDRLNLPMLLFKKGLLTLIYIDSFMFLAKLCPSLRYYLLQTSIYSGTVTITSLPNLVSSKPSPTGPPPCAAILSCSKKKRSTSGGL